MEYKQPHELINQFFELRNRLRNHIAIETIIIDRINQLPEDDFCHQAREAYQLGAGYAWLVHEVEPDSYDIDAFSPDRILGMDTGVFLAACHTFHRLRPRNKYTPWEEETERTDRLNRAVRSILVNESLEDISSETDIYDLEEQLAFVEGVATVLTAASSMRIAEQSASYGT